MITKAQAKRLAEMERRAVIARLCPSSAKFASRLGVQSHEVIGNMTISEADFSERMASAQKQISGAIQ